MIIWFGRFCLALKAFHWWSVQGGASYGGNGSASIDFEMEPSSDYVLAFTSLTQHFMDWEDSGGLFAAVSYYRKRDPKTGIDLPLVFLGGSASSAFPGVPVFSGQHISAIGFMYGAYSNHGMVSGSMSFFVFQIG